MLLTNRLLHEVKNQNCLFMPIYIAQCLLLY